MLTKRMKKDKILFFAGLVIIILFNIQNIERRNVPYIFGDEFGYWSNAAQLLGYDWSGIAKKNGHFSFGYSLLLLPLFGMNRPSMMYKMAIILNVLFIALSYILCIKFIQYFRPSLKAEYRYLISLALSFYPSLTVFAQITLCENLLYLMFWILCLLLISIERKVSLFKFVLLGAVLGYFYAIHLRTIGIIAACVLYLMYLCFYKKTKFRNALVTLIILFLSIILVSFLDNYLSEMLNGGNDFNNSNSYSGQMDKLRYFFSFEGIKAFIFSFAGKCFYLCSSSLFLIFWFLKASIQNLHRNIENSSICIFLLLSLFFSLVISSLYMINPTRIDNVIYGRYNEYLMGPILVVGILYLFKSVSYLDFSISSLVYTILSFIVEKNFENNELTEIVRINIAGVYSYITSVEKENIIYVIVIISVLIAFVLACLSINSSRKKIWSLILILFVWTYAFYKSPSYIGNVSYAQQEAVYSDISEYLYENKVDEIIFTYIEGKDSFSNAFWGSRIQFLMPNVKVELYDLQEMYENNIIPDLCLVRKDSFADMELHKTGRLILTDGDIKLYTFTLDKR